MKKLTEQQILDNWTRFKDVVENTFTGDRKSSLLKLLDHFSERMMLAPASSKEHYHCAHPGGYMEHVLNVYDISLDMAEIWKKYSSHIDYTPEELTLVVLFHDLGKIGDLTEDFYFPQDNDWRRNNLGEIYKVNPNVTNMNNADRSLYMLQHFGVQLTQNEWIAIKIHEGLFDEGNEHYLKTASDNNVIKSHLPHLVHHSDMMATRIEYEEWKNSASTKDVESQPKQVTKKYGTKKGLAETIANATSNPLTNFFDKEKADGVSLSLDSLFEDTKKEK